MIIIYKEIKENTIDGKHKFIVIGSDGLWEFLGNEEVLFKKKII